MVRRRSKKNNNAGEERAGLSPPNLSPCSPRFQEKAKAVQKIVAIKNLRRRSGFGKMVARFKQAMRGLTGRRDLTTKKQHATNPNKILKLTWSWQKSKTRKNHHFQDFLGGLHGQFFVSGGGKHLGAGECLQICNLIQNFADFSLIGEEVGKKIPNQN